MTTKNNKTKTTYTGNTKNKQEKLTQLTQQSRSGLVSLLRAPASKWSGSYFHNPVSLQGVWQVPNRQGRCVVNTGKQSSQSVSKKLQ